LNAVVAVANPVEHLHAVSATPGGGAPTTSVADTAGKLLKGVGSALAVHTFFLAPSHRPTLLIEWLAICAAVLLWRRGEKQVALQISVLLLAAFLVDASFTLRRAGSIKVYYTPYTDPLIVLAGALAAARFTEEIFSRAGRKAILAFMAIYVTWGQFEAARATYGQHGKHKVCGVAAPALRRVAVPYCKDFKWQHKPPPSNRPRL
jgi:hypothetical protein